MTLLDHRPSAPLTTTHFARWAWTALGVTPFVLALALVGSFAGGEGGSNIVGGAVVGLLCLLAPTLAVCFAGAAVHLGEAGGRNVLATAVAALALTVVLLPLIAVGVVGWLVAMVLDAAAVGGYFAWRYCR